MQLLQEMKILQIEVKHRKKWIQKELNSLTNKLSNLSVDTNN